MTPFDRDRTLAVRDLPFRISTFIDTTPVSDAAAFGLSARELSSIHPVTARTDNPMANILQTCCCHSFAQRMVVFRLDGEALHLASSRS